MIRIYHKLLSTLNTLYVYGIWWWALAPNYSVFHQNVFVDQRQRIYRHDASNFKFFWERNLTPQLQSLKSTTILSIDVITFLIMCYGCKLQFESLADKNLFSNTHIFLLLPFCTLYYHYHKIISFVDPWTYHSWTGLVRQMTKRVVVFINVVFGV